MLLEAGKEYLVEARLLPLAESAGQGTVQRYIDRLRTTPVGVDHWAAIEAMTTNETSFYRDLHPFESLRMKIIPALIDARGQQRTLEIWSAACSSGQEPYSVAMILREHFAILSRWRCRIRASDIARGVLKRAREGLYNQAEISRGMPPELLAKYFDREGSQWRLSSKIRQMVEFFEFNLTSRWSSMPPMDFVLLRNVLIYFDVRTKRSILEKVRRVLRPDGYLLLGNAETVRGVHEGFEPLADDRGGWHRVRT